MLIKQMSIHNFSFHIKIDDTANKSIIYNIVSQKIADRFFFLLLNIQQPIYRERGQFFRIHQFNTQEKKSPFLLYFLLSYK